MMGTGACREDHWGATGQRVQNFSETSTTWALLVCSLFSSFRTTHVLGGHPEFSCGRINMYSALSLGFEEACLGCGWPEWRPCHQSAFLFRMSCLLIMEPSALRITSSPSSSKQEEFPVSCEFLNHSGQNGVMPWIIPTRMERDSFKYSSIFILEASPTQKIYLRVGGGECILERQSLQIFTNYFVTFFFFETKSH